MASPAAPSSSRLVTKLCVHGRVPAASSSPSSAATASSSSPSGPSDGSPHAAAATAAGPDGVRIDLLCKVVIPLVGGTQSYPLFPDQRIRLLSSSTYPLSQHASLVLSPPPPAAILDAAQHLRVGTTFERQSSSAAARGQPTVKVAVQDFAVCLLTEGGPDRKARAGPGGGRSFSAFSPSPQAEAGGAGAESSPWIVVMELFVPWLSGPPLDRTSILVPLPRCLSNTLAFHLLLPPADPNAVASDEADEYSFATAPKLLSTAADSADGAGGASADELVLRGTFQSTPQLEIRWRPAAAVPPMEGSASGPSAKGLASLRDVVQTVEWTVQLSTATGDAGTETIVLGLQVEVEADLHYAGVESIAYLEAALSLPPSVADFSAGQIEWVDPPSFSADRGLASYHPSDPTASLTVDVADDASFDTTTTSTIQSPSPSHARVRQPHQPLSQQSSLGSSFSRSTSSSGGGGVGGQSSSLPSLLRQQLPSSSSPTAGADSTSADISFAAFDSSTQPSSPGPNPSLKHRSPLGHSSASSAELGNQRRRRRTGGADDEGGRTSQSWRIGVEVSKVHELGHRWRLRWSGEVRVAVGEDGRVVLPNVGVGGTDGTAGGTGRVSVKAPAGWDLVPPPDAQRSAGSSKGKMWDVPVSTSTSSPPTGHFTLARPSAPKPAEGAGPSTSSPRRATPSSTLARHQRGSSLGSSFSPPSGIGGATALAPDPNSPFWVGNAADTTADTLPHVELEAILVPSPASSSADERGTQQLTSMMVALPFLSDRRPADESGEENDDDDTFEFGIVALSPASRTPTDRPTVRVLSATVNAVPVAWDLQLPLTPAEGEQEEEGADEAVIPGALGYVQLRAAGLRAVGGEVRVQYVVELPAPAVEGKRWWSKGKRREGLVLGLPSFEEGVAWLETRVSAAEGMTVDVLSSSPTLTPLARSARSSPARLVAHSLPPLSTSHLLVAVRPAPPAVSAPPRPSALSWSTILGVLLALWLLASVGLEVREVKERLGGLALELRGLRGEKPSAPGPSTAVDWWADTTASSSSPLAPPVETLPVDGKPESTSLLPADRPTSSTEPSAPTDTSTILRPSFTAVPPPPPFPPPSPPAPVAPPPADALARPLAVYFPALQAVLRRADGVLVGSAVGRGLRNLVVGFSRAVSWVVFG